MPLFRSCSGLKKLLFFRCCLNFLDLKMFSHILLACCILSFFFSGSGVRNLPLTWKPIPQVTVLTFFSFCSFLEASSTWSCCFRGQQQTIPDSITIGFFPSVIVWRSKESNCHYIFDSGQVHIYTLDIQNSTSSFYSLISSIIIHQHLCYWNDPMIALLLQ